MDPRRLRLLRELARLGSMQLVADELGVTTSTVSQQIAALARDVGLALIEPDGRRVRLTPGGRRLAEHAEVILAAIDTARADLQPGDPSGTVRVAGFATAIRRALLPAIRDLSLDHPQITLRVREHEPPESLELLAAGTVDLALVYDFTVAPRVLDESLEVLPLWTASWSMGVPDDPEIGHCGADTDDLTAPEVLSRLRDRLCIVNSRDTADETVLRLLGSLAGFTPRIAHRADSLELVVDLITGGQGIGLLPEEWPSTPGVRKLRLRDPGVVQRAFVVTRRGHAQWAPLGIVRRLLTDRASAGGAASRSAERGAGSVNRP